MRSQRAEIREHASRGGFARAALARGGPSAAEDQVITIWVDQAAAAAGTIAAGKFSRLRAWMDEQAAAGGTLADLRGKLTSAPGNPLFETLASPEEVVLHQQAVLATALRGMLATQRVVEARRQEAEGRSQKAESQLAYTRGAEGLAVHQEGELFAKLPFRQAIAALAERLAIPKDDFLKLDAAARSRAFTMARVADQEILANIHDEIVEAIENGETYEDFAKRLEDVQERTGWVGSEPWHYRLVYDTNLGMAYTAGRLQQGQDAGLVAWRYLPSLSDEPRPEHREYYGQVFRASPGRPMPPWDFNCACGWEWIFNDELEAMDIDPENLPEFDPPPPESGFVWSAIDYLASRSQKAGGRRQKAEMSRQMTEPSRDRAEAELRTVVCDVPITEGAVVGEVPGRILIIPWGRVQSTKGDFLLDEEAAYEIIGRFLEQGVDLPVDYEHTTIGGEFSSPDGSAPAMGWIKALEREPDVGLFARVEWTPRGRQYIQTREYRYPSPVVRVRPADERAIELHSVGLTNKPAILRMPAIVNSDRSAAPDDAASGSLRKESHMTLKDRVRQIAGNASASAEERLRQVSAAVEAEASALTVHKETVDKIGAEAGKMPQEGRPIAEALAKGDVDEACKSLVTLVHSLHTRIAGMVPAGEISQLTARIGKLETEIADRDCTAMIVAHSNKLPPSKHDWFRGWFKVNRADAEAWIKDAPELVNREADKTAAGGGPVAREGIIAQARAKFAAENQGKVVLCSERLWVDQVLREARLPKLTEEEAAKHAIAA